MLDKPINLSIDKVETIGYIRRTMVHYINREITEIEALKEIGKYVNLTKEDIKNIK